VLLHTAHWQQAAQLQQQQWALQQQRAVSLQPQHEATHPSQQGPLDGVSSVLQLLGAGAASGAGALGVMRRVLLLLCPNSWQWAALLAAAVVYTLKRKAAAAASASPAGLGLRCRSTSNGGTDL
jgi:hypothetical protein